jgi:hypothetical protein
MAPGRVWGHATCPVVPLIETGTVNPSCNGEVDFLFEQCSQ